MASVAHRLTTYRLKPETVIGYGGWYKLPVDAIEQHSVELIVRLGQAWISDHVLNQPVRTKRGTLA
jgi:hypothetical protein